MKSLHCAIFVLPKTWKKKLSGVAPGGIHTLFVGQAAKHHENLMPSGNGVLLRDSKVALSLNKTLFHDIS